MDTRMTDAFRPTPSADVLGGSDLLDTAMVSESPPKLNRHTARRACANVCVPAPAAHSKQHEPLRSIDSLTPVGWLVGQWRGPLPLRLSHRLPGHRLKRTSDDEGPMI